MNLNERAHILDILRGFALLGICVANAAYFSLYIFQSSQKKASLPHSEADRILEYISVAFVEGKFYSLFSLLFGIGFAIIFFVKTNANNKGLYFFYRRLFFLLLFGLLHSFLIWDGDILFFYAITGLLLPLFRKLSYRTLIVWSVILLLSPLLFDVLKVMTDGKWNISKPFLQIARMLDKKAGIEENGLPDWLIIHNRYIDELRWNRSGFFWSWQLRLDSNRVPKVLAMFLLGLCIGRSGFYQKLRENSAMIKRVMIWCFAIGITAGAGLVYFHQDGKTLPSSAGLLDTLFYALNVAPLSLAYASAISLIYIKKRAILNWLQPAGQMALTNYIMQSVLCILIFHGIGLGLGSNIGPIYFIPIAIAVFLLQVGYSYFWMRYFNYGPLEWIWRQLTYGKIIRLRKTGSRT